MYQSSADCGRLFRPKGKSCKMFDTIVPTKSVSLNLDLCGGYSPAALPLSARIRSHNVMLKQITREAMCVWRDTDAHLRNHCCRGIATSITCSECVYLALVIHYAKGMRLIILSSAACLTPTYFPTISHKGHDFFFKSLNVKCLFWFSLQILSEIFLILRIMERDVIINVCRSSWQVPVILVRFEWNLHFLGRFVKNTQISRRVFPCGRTDTT